MVSVPLLTGSDVIGVFNAVASAPDAFDPAETSYLMSLGGILSVAVNVWFDREAEPPSVDPSDSVGTV